MNRHPHLAGVSAARAVVLGAIAAAGFLYACISPKSAVDAGTLAGCIISKYGQPIPQVVQACDGATLTLVGDIFAQQRQLLERKTVCGTPRVMYTDAGKE